MTNIQRINTNILKTMGQAIYPYAIHKYPDNIKTYADIYPVGESEVIWEKFWEIREITGNRFYVYNKETFEQDYKLAILDKIFKES